MPSNKPVHFLGHKLLGLKDEIELQYKILKYALDTKVTKVIQPFHAMLIWLNSPFKASVSHWTLYAYRHTFTILSLAKIPPQSFKSA